MSTRPRILDLFCGAGGAAMGYYRAGFDVVGVDLEPQPNYPFEFHRADALDCLSPFFIVDPVFFDAVHASPPCQAYSRATVVSGDRAAHPDLVAPVRELLEASGLPWIIENVIGAPTRHHTVLCGSMFGLGANGRQLRRHRAFETSFPMLSPPCQHRGAVIGVYGGGPNQNGKKGYQGTVAEKAEALGIDWMSGADLNQAIPPAYTEHVGWWLLQALQNSGVGMTPRTGNRYAD